MNIFLFLYFFYSFLCLSTFEMRENIMNIRILTMARPRSLKRLLDSLMQANYLNDIINLEIFVDCMANSSLIDLSTKVLVQNFNWSFGAKSIKFNRYNKGLKRQWLQNYSFDVPFMIIEDDIIVSKDFYKISKQAITYISTKTSIKKYIFGISLQKLTIIIKNDNCPFYNTRICLKKLKLKTNETFFLPQMSSWAPIVFPEKWKMLIEYHNYFKTLNNTYPCIPGAITNRWLDTSGTFMQYFLYVKAFFMMYFNIQSDIIFNFREKGIHFSGKSKLPSYKSFVFSKTKIKYKHENFFDHNLRPIVLTENFTFDQKILDVTDKAQKCFVRNDKIFY